MRGRIPSGPEYGNRLDGSEEAKQRLQAILETMSRSCRVQEACERLDICEQRFQQLRTRALQAALDSLETRPGGRPARVRTAAEKKVKVLEGQIQDLEIELRAARLREELALVLPEVVHGREEELEKKARRRLRKG